MVRRSIRLVVLIGATLALVAVAGCSGPLADDSAPDDESAPGNASTPDNESTPGAAATPDSARSANITVDNGSFAADPDRVYERLQDLRDTEYPAPARIHLRDLADVADDDSGPVLAQFNPTPLWDHLNLSSTPVDLLDEIDLLFQGSVSATGTVTIFLHEQATAEAEEIVLAHELTHYVQVQSGQMNALVEGVDTTTTDGVYVRRSVVEGEAVYTTDEYLETYDVTDERNAPLYDRIAAQYPPGDANRFRNSQYVVGHEYVRSQVDDPADVDRLYENPPTTTEQLLHHLPPGSEPPVPLSIDRTTDEDWRYVGDDRMGEAFLRYALASELGEESAASAAAGWGNDSLQIYRSTDGGEPSYAWVLRWDDAANATEFEDAAGETFDSLGSDGDGSWDLADSDAVASVERPTERTVVLLLGAESFVERTAVEGEDGGISLATG